MKTNTISQLTARYAIYGIFVILLLVTAMTGHGGRTMTLNYFFLAVMFILVAVFNFMGIRRLQILSEDLEKNAGILSGITSAFAGKLYTLSVKFRIDSVEGDWKRFAKDWESSSGMDCQVEEYINEDELLDVTHAGLCSLVPGFLTSLGILGTFIGLVAGLGGIDFSDYDQMTRSVEGLVGGLYVAFYTSIYGISLSIIFNFSFRYFSSGLSVSLDRFYDAFREHFHGVTQKSMVDTFRDNQEDGLEQMRQAVGYLDHVDGYLKEGLGTELGNQISGNILPVFSDINTSLKNAMQGFQEAQDNALGKIVDEFVFEMQGLMQEPIENMSKSMEGHVNALGSSVKKLSDSQTRMTKKLTELIERIENTSNNTEQVNENSAKIIEQLNNYVEKLNTTSEASTRMVENMNTQSAALMEKLDTYSQNMNDVAQEQKQVLGDLRDHESKLNLTFAGMEVIQSRLSGNIVSFSESAKELAKRQADPINLTGIETLLQNYTSKAESSRQVSNIQMKESLDQMQESMGVLQETFEKMLEYQENIQIFTGRMTNALTSGARGTNAGSSGQPAAQNPVDLDQLLMGQQAMQESLDQFNALLKAEQERRSRPLPQRVADFFRGSKQ